MNNSMTQGIQAAPNPNSIATQHLEGKVNTTMQKKIISNLSEYAQRTEHNFRCIHERNRD